jgi:hypothetical protein
MRVYAPSKDTAGKVVDYGMEVNLIPVEELDDCQIDMPKLGLGYTLPHFRFGRIDPFARSSPTVLANLLAPGGGGSE